MGMVHAIIEKIKKLFTSAGQLSRYMVISVSVTVVDVIISYCLEWVVGPNPASAIGTVTGFIIQYFLVTKHVFAGRTKRAMLVFFLTFLFGLALAQAIIYIFRHWVFVGDDSTIVFLVSKGMSMVVPFFVTYALRKKLM